MLKTERIRGIGKLFGDFSQGGKTPREPQEIDQIRRFRWGRENRLEKRVRIA
jgi:hypothetical protein